MQTSHLTDEPKYGRIAGNPSINRSIYRCFELIDETDADRFARRFGEQDEDQQLHTYRELLLGAYLSRFGCRVKNDLRIGGKTPDWTLLSDNATPICLVEVTSFHNDKPTDEDIKMQLRERGFAGWWGNPGLSQMRILSKITEKLDAYEGIAIANRISLIVAVFSTFDHGFEKEDTLSCLEGDSGLFNNSPGLSGVIHFDDSGRGGYRYYYIQNPNAKHMVGLPAFGLWDASVEAG